MAVICLTARDTARRVWRRSAPTGPSKSDVFPRGDTFRRASYRQFFVMHSAIWIFSRLSEQIKQSFCENLYGACRGTPGLRIVFAWVFRYNKYRCCLHKGYLQKAGARRRPAAEGACRVKKKGWFSVLQNLSWLTQLGLSLAAPPVLCLLGAGWLARRFSLGPWVYFAAIVLGLGAAACTFAEFVKMFRRKNGKK